MFTRWHPVVTCIDRSIILHNIASTARLPKVISVHGGQRTSLLHSPPLYKWLPCCEGYQSQATTLRLALTAYSMISSSSAQYNIHGLQWLRPSPSKTKWFNLKIVPAIAYIPRYMIVLFCKDKLPPQTLQTFCTALARSIPGIQPIFWLGFAPPLMPGEFQTEPRHIIQECRRWDWVFAHSQLNLKRNAV